MVQHTYQALSDSIAACIAWDILLLIHANENTLPNTLHHVALDYVNAATDHGNAPRRRTNSP